MKEIRIEIVNTHLEEMGCDQPIRYATLRFNESHFIGYWISNEGENLTFYLGSQSFICKNSQKNIDIFESILSNEKEKVLNK